MKKIIYVFLFVFMSALCFGMWSDTLLFDLENNIVRLHILANSDGEYDQQLKIKVRDNILEYAKKNEKVPTPTQMEALANKVLLMENAPYKAKANVGKYYIDRRAYESFILPEGMYTAARIELGEAEGKNWWCVLSPPLCFTKSSFGYTDDLGEYLTAETENTIKGDRITIKLKVLELFSKLRHNYVN